MTTRRQLAPIDLSSAVVEGLTVGEFQFVGRSSATPKDSVVDGRSLQIPRQSDATPGIVADRLHFAEPAPTPLKWADTARGFRTTRQLIVAN